MSMALLIAGYEQSFIERAMGGSTWQAYFDGQTQPWFIQAMWWRMVFGVIMTAGLVLLLVDFVKIGAGDDRPIRAVPSEAIAEPEAQSEELAEAAAGS